MPSKAYPVSSIDAAAVSGDGSVPATSARLRILQVTQSYYPFLDRGGAPMVVHALARGLAKSGHQVTVLTSDLGIENAQRSGDSLAVRVPEGWRSESGSVQTIYLAAQDVTVR